MKKGFVRSPVPGREHIVEIVELRDYECGGKTRTVVRKTLGQYDCVMKICYDWEVIYKDQQFWENLHRFVKDNHMDKLSDYPTRHREPRRKRK